MARPLKYELLGPKKIMRVPEAVVDIERLYEPLNNLMVRGERPKDILSELERLLTALDAIGEDPCEVLSAFCDRLEEK